jgi:glycosyltransferase involved in cell wall biosynthesis
MSSLRTLVIAEALPYPTFKGGDLRVWQNINGLMKVGQVGVFGLCSNDQRSAEVPTGIALWRSSSDPGLAYPLPQGWKLRSRGWPLDPNGHPFDSYYSDDVVTELIKLMAEFGPQVVVIEGLVLYRYIEPLRRQNCRLVLDSHNVETALHQRRAKTTLGNDLPSRLIRDVLPARTRMIERHATRAVDQIWACSDDDARLMRELHGSLVPIHVVPNGVDVGSYDAVHASRCSCPETVTKKPLIFPGMFAYWPNAAAAIFLIEEVFPRLASRYPDCQLLLVGTLPTPRMLQAAKRDPRILVTGAVPDIRPYLAAASVLVAPLFEGSGTRFKILEALAANVPVISTGKGAEGLQVKNGTHLLMAETADDFVDAVQRIWTDERLRQHLTANGRDLVEQYYSWSVAGWQIRQALHELGLNG